MICADCDTENTDAANFCLSCGVRLRSPASRPTAERRPMHVVFCDVVGSTTLSEQLDPEDFRSLLQHFQSVCATVVSRFEGYLAQFLGDGVLVYFGYPRAHEDDACRAVRAGLEIVRTVSRTEVGGRKLQVRVGIHSGVVVVGKVGVSGRRAELAVGETPNVAARVQSQAEPDTVAISQATERLVRGFFSLEDLGPRSLRGLKNAVRVYSVIAESGARTRLEAAQAGGLTRFVARTEEMGVLLRNWDETTRGQGRVLSIRGEAGVGKSRLVEAFKAKLPADGVEVVHCACSEYLRNSAFHPLAATLQNESKPDVDWLARCARRFGLSPAQADGVLADVLSDQSDRAAAPSDLPPSRRRQLTMEALSNWLLSMDGGACKLAILEDVHWADASTLELIEATARRLTLSRVLLLLTFRPDFRARWTLGEGMPVLHLRPLLRSDASLMASFVAGRKALPTALADRLNDWTNGVPLYIEEFTKGLLESGALIEREDRFELSGPLPRNLIPETLAGPMAARIDRMGSAKPVVQLSAVMGMEIRRDMLAAVADLEERTLSEALERLLSAELLVDSTTDPGRVFHFRHALIRDAAYNSLLLTDRRDIHGRIFETIQRDFPELAENRPEIVAYHASEAALPEVAATHWQRASERALARAANWEALAHIDEGQRQLQRLADAPARYERQLVFELARGPALMAVKGFAAPEVVETYRRANDLCKKLGDPSRLGSVMWGNWANKFVAGQLVAARDLGEQLLRLAESTQERALLVPASHALGYTLCYCGEFERAVELALPALSTLDLESERTNTRLFQFSSAVALRHTASVSLWMLGFPDQALVHAREAIRLAEALAHPPSMAYAHSALTWGAPFLLGDFVALDAAAQEAIVLSREEAYSLWPPLVQVFRGWSTVSSGDVHAGLAHMHEAYGEYRATGGGILRPTIGALLAEATWKAGAADDALAIITTALSEIESTQEHNFEPELFRVRGEVQAYLGLDMDAEASFGAAQSLARRQRARSLELRAALALSAFLSARHRGGEGRALVKEVYDTFTEGLETPDLRAARAVLGVPAPT
ncbi:MAG: AAA family ATPase [Myxococcota bacterium]|nr:AAA family ATPase [Myxococcota bacterium]